MAVNFTTYIQNDISGRKVSLAHEGAGTTKVADPTPAVSIPPPVSAPVQLQPQGQGDPNAVATTNVGKKWCCVLM